ncbi:MAG: aldose 1-epimerase family protein [Schleiferilactobacillus perolens]|uniref:aldose 1-epimerase family protein n=1 Tax=Schleiferilactobacillus perolens TaxID=100468 RepID=UPI0039EB3A71
MQTIRNEFLTVQISEHGAELQSIRDKNTNTEYLWQGDPAIWGRRAPVLFPIVGALHNGEYSYAGKTYQMGRHGFARDRDFAVVQQSADEVIFELNDDAESRKIYPFAFDLRIRYALLGNLLKVRYYVTNPSKTEPLWFSVGGHPAFNTGLGQTSGTAQDYLRFSPKKSRVTIPLGEGGGADLQERTLAPTDVDLAITDKLFAHDALIYELAGENTVSLRQENSEHRVELTVKDAPYIGIWSQYPKTGPFVALEPWWGIADPVGHDGQLTHKLGMHQLAPEEQFTAKYRIGIF